MERLLDSLLDSIHWLADEIGDSLRYPWAWVGWVVVLVCLGFLSFLVFSLAMVWFILANW